MKKKKVEKLLIDPVFIPIDYDVYKKEKIYILNTQIKVLECIKTINRIRQLQKEKDELKKELYKTLRDALDLYYKIKESYMPIINNPQFMNKLKKTVEIAINYKKENESASLTYSKTITKTDEMDNELREIQAKLNALVSSKEVR